MKTAKEDTGVKTATLVVASPAFKEGELMPKEFTADGENVSPPLAWSNVPDDAKSIALVCEDPDAPRGTFVHWVIFNIDPKASGLPRAVPTAAMLQGGAQQGRNDFGKVGYGGPAPPAGPAHRYYFKVYALDAPLALESGAKKEDLLSEIEGHVLAEGQVMARYGRSK
ncbi:MAG TPA: YbhB/YbcL family Raf kinase inhibitor-like protein [Planctomycetota bacterium]|nr:YbhB/YbcL family Raf kinase inhibitor-like protein [Planctomycetota bacterium]